MKYLVNAPGGSVPTQKEYRAIEAEAKADTVAPEDRESFLMALARTLVRRETSRSKRRQNHDYAETTETFTVGIAASKVPVEPPSDDTG